MRIREFVSLFIFMLILVGCNTSEQDTPATRDSSSLGAETFFYNERTLEVVQNVTFVNIYPILEKNASYQILPALPDGMEMNSQSGVISGIPSEELEETVFLITASSSKGNDYAQITLSVLSEPPSTLSYGVSVLEFTQDVNASYALTVNGGEADSFSVSPDLPNGLTIDSDGTLGGTPTAASSAFYTVTGEGDNGSAEVKVKIIVRDAIPTFATTAYSNDEQDVFTNDGITPADANIANDFITMMPSLSNSPTEVNYKITPALPSGMSLDSSTGAISGNPTEKPVHFEYTVTAYNDSGSDSTEVTIYIHDIIQEFTYVKTQVDAEIDVPVASNSVATYKGGKNPVYSLSCDIDNNGTYGDETSPTNCAGILLNSTNGRLYGTPSSATLGGPTPVSIIVTVTYDGAIINGVSEDPPALTETVTLTYNVTEDYPSDASNIGYASVYTIYKDKTVSLTPGVLSDGEPTSYKLADESFDAGAPAACAGTCDLPIDGLEIDYTTGEISGTPTSAADVTFIIEGYNLDETGASVKTAQQTVQIKVEVLAPQGISYYASSGATVPASCSILSGTSDVYDCDNGITLSPSWSPNIPVASGTPDVWTISPQLPSGMSFNPTTGVISGRPAEITDTRYYYITATNDGGSYATSLALYTNNLVAPTTLSYVSGSNDLDYNLFDYELILADYEGGDATFTATPINGNTKTLADLGLTLDTSTGAIYGTPIQSLADPSGTANYTITATNTSGTVSVDIEIQVDNVAIANLQYFGSDEVINDDAAAPDNTIYRPIYELGDIISSANLQHSSDYDANNPGSSAGFIETYTEISAGFTLADYGLTLDSTTGDITGTIAQVPALKRELNLSHIRTQTAANNIVIQGSSAAAGSGGAIDNSATSFSIAVKAQAPEISYPDTGNGDNVVVIFGAEDSAANDDEAEFYQVQNDGGLIATLANGAASAQNCSATLVSSRNFGVGDEPNDVFNLDAQYEDFYDDDGNNTCSAGGPCEDLGYGGSNNFTFEGTNCSFRFNRNACFSSGGFTGDTRVYQISAQNSGTWDTDETTLSPVTRTVTVHTYDGPNFSYEPDSTGSNDYIFFENTQLTLDGTDTTAAYTPNTTNMCHEGDFSLDDFSDLPTELTFDASSGEIAIDDQVLLGRRSFTLSSTESASGLNLSKTENITVQANHIEDNADNDEHTFDITVMDVNADGNEDFILRSKQCDDLSCATNATTLYLQDDSMTGLFLNAETASPNPFSVTGINAITGFTYDSANSKGGLVYIRPNGSNVNTLSTTTALETSSTALTNDGFGIVPMERGEVANFGVFTHNAAGNQMTIEQFTITGNDMSAVAANATTATVNFESFANGGLDLAAATGAIEYVTFNNMGGSSDATETAFVVARDTSGDRYICGISVDTSGADPSFGDTCSPRLPVQNNGVVRKIKFADVDNDGLDDMFVLSYESGTNSSTIYVYENRNDFFTGLYQNLDVITLKSSSSLLSFDVKDLDGDGNVDIIASDVEGDLDTLRSDRTTDSVSDTVVSGYTIYFNTTDSDIFSPTSTQTEDTIFFYSRSAGHTHNVEMITAPTGSGNVELLLNCSISTQGAGNTDTDLPATTSNASDTPLNLPNTAQESSCGIVGAF